MPYCFESRLSGIGDTSFHPWMWYRRAVTLPAEWKGRRVLLHFGAVNYWSMVWVNGKLAGSHEGGNTPFAFDVTPLLQPGANVLTVRAHFPPTDRYIPRGKQYWEPKSKSIFYTRTSGIWQPVWMEPVGASYLDRVKITPAHRWRRCAWNSPSRVRSRTWKSRRRPASPESRPRPPPPTPVRPARHRAALDRRAASSGRPRRPISTTSRWNCAAAARCSIACKSYFGIRSVAAETRQSPAERRARSS